MLEDKDKIVVSDNDEELSEHKDKVYKCGDCMRTVYLMEAGHGKDIECCDKKMRVLSPKEMKPYHPRFPKPGSP